MATSASPKSFLDLPKEVRLNVYEQVFRAKNVSIHEVWTKSHHRRLRRRKSCVSLMLVNKLISQEAKPVFLRETSFFLDNCRCWQALPEEKDIPFPQIKNLTISAGLSSSFLDPIEGIGSIFASLQSTMGQGRKMDSLVCHPTIHEEFKETDAGLDEQLDILMTELPQISQNVEFTFCACSSNMIENVQRRFLVKVKNDGGYRKVSVHCAKQDDLKTIAGIFEMFDHDLKDAIWSPDTTGMPAEDRMCTEQFEGFLASMGGFR